MGEVADRHVRLSEESYRRLEKRKRGNESFDDVVKRLLEDDRDLLAGFGAAERRDRDMEAVHDETTRRSKNRIERFSSGREGS